MRHIGLRRSASFLALFAAVLGGVWLPALAGWTPQEATVVHEDTKSIGNLDVAVNADGDALAVFTQSSASGTAVLATLRTDGVWSTPAPVGDGPGTSVFPLASIDGPGNATVVWTRWAGESKTISYAVRPAGGAWSAPTELSAQGESLAVTTGPTGAVSAVWKSPIGAGVTVAEKPVEASTWTVTQLTASGGFSPAVAAAPDGRVAVAWDDGRIQARIRASGGTWAGAAAETPSGPGPVVFSAREPVIAFGADGLLHAAWYEVLDDDPNTEQVRTGSRNASGDWTVHPDPISGTHWIARPSDIVADAAGNVTVAVSTTDQQESGPWIQRYWATTRHDGTWETGFPLTGPDPGTGLATPRLLIDGDGLVTAIWGQDYKVMANRRDGLTSWLAAAEQVSRENSHSPAAALDGSGKVLALWNRNYWTYDPSVFHALLETKTYDDSLPPGDTTGPTTTMTKPGKPYYLATTVPLAWTATDESPITDYRWRFRAAPWNGALPSTWDIITIWSPATSTSYPTKPGRTYCFSARARDSLGNEGAWSAQRCTASPVDDRQAVRSGSWTKKSGSAFYRGTALVSSVHGSKLTLAGAQAKRIALVVDKRPGAGKVSVFFRGVKLGTWSLASSTTKHRVVIPVKTWPSVRSGNLVVKVTGSGKRVWIDGVVVGRV